MDWIPLIHIQLGTLGLRELIQEVHKLDGFPHGVMMLQLKVEQTVITSVQLKASEEESVWWLFPNLVLSGKMVRAE